LTAPLADCLTWVAMLHRIKHSTSIRAQLSFVFLLLLVVDILVGLESLRSLRLVNDAAAEIRTRWLPSTHALGDLNNFTTDVPPAAAAGGEGSPAKLADTEGRLAYLDRGIESAQIAYRQIQHDIAEDKLYEQFAAHWKNYRDLVMQRLSSAGAESQSGAALLQSLDGAYGAASQTLSQLTALNTRGEREAIDRSNRAYTEAKRRTATMIILAGLLVAGALIYVTRSISMPLVGLALRMHGLAANETASEVSGAERLDEIGDMARAVRVFRDNAVDLASSREALAQQAAMLQERLVEEQRLMRLQRNFVSMASHEFGTPLAVIDGHAQRLEAMRDRLTATELVERVRKVRSAVNRLTHLINNLVGSARLIDGRIGLTFRPAQIDLSTILRDACSLQRELTPDANIHDGDIAAALFAHGDPSLVSQAVGNLLSNAVKYSPGNEPIVVSGFKAETEVAIVIDDNGLGVPESDRRRIFESYYRGSNTSGIVGSGVGLYLVKAIAELHGGAVELEPKGGGGSRFIFRIRHRQAP
jgi:two-component system OmpR family sensor kinase